MDRRVVPVIALLALATVAGCGGAGDTPTETPAAAVAAPGVTQDGVVDRSRLADAHAASLRNRSYTLRVTFDMRRGDGDRRRLVRVLRVGPRHEHLSFVQRIPRRPTDVFATRVPFVAWSDGERTFVRSAAGNETVTLGYRYAFQSELLGAEEAIHLYLGRAARADVRRVERDGWIAYRIEATDSGEADAIPGRTAVAVVDSFGLVRQIHVAGPAGEFFWLPFDFRTRWDRIEVTVRYTAVGETTVERPDWVEDSNATDAPGSGAAPTGI